MVSTTKRLFIVICLAFTMAWFTGLRDQIGAFYSNVGDGKSTGYAGLVDNQDWIEDSLDGEVYDLLSLKAQFSLLGEIPAGPTPGIEPENVQVGDESSFWIFDEGQGEPYQITATLKFASQMTLMYVDNNIEIDQHALEEAALQFETTIYPRTRELFGHEDSPGLDGDPRLTILHTPLMTAGGYYSSADTEPLEVNRFSNRREMFVIGSNSYLPGDDNYLMILAHEFQHMIHANQQPASPAWFNEGMSMLAQDLNGYWDDELAVIYLANPDISLTDWAQNASETGEHYGAAQLFLRYFYQHYGGDEILINLIRSEAGKHHQVFADLAAISRPDIRGFYEVFADWAVANLVNDATIADGRYGYDGLPAHASIVDRPGSPKFGKVNQLGVDYLGVFYGPTVLEFDGEDAVGLTGTRPIQGDWMWWSGRGDARAATLTRAFDLREVHQATLQFSTWFEIERHYDYAYVVVSTDEGETWQTLPGRETSHEDPQGINLGHGITGVSGRKGAHPERGQRGRWVQESMDLTAYSGYQILLRFLLVTDPAYNAQGLLIDDIRIPQIGYRDGAEEGYGGWEAVGFVRTTGGVPQNWILRLVVETDAGTEVREVELDLQNRARIELAAGERSVLVIIGTSPITDEPANYSLKTGKDFNLLNFAFPGITDLSGGGFK